MRTARLSLAALLALLPALPASAHEFWLEPDLYRVPEGGTVAARAYNGEEFEGVEFSYNAAGYRRSGVLYAGTEHPLRGDNGDRPAAQAQALGPGLHVIFHSSPMASLTYDGMEKFASFLRGKHLDAGIARHRERGLPETDIREVYFRFVKALVAVGPGEGKDRAVGQPWEFVALSNPYTGGGDVRVRLLDRGKPVAGHPVYVFRRTGGRVEKIDLTTDGNGTVAVPRRPGEYMVNAVKLSEPSERIAESTGAHWQTLWAALTYEIGG